MWTSTYKVTVESQTKIDPHGLSAIKDAIADAAMETAMAQEVGDVSVALMTIEDQREVQDCGHELIAESILGHCRACDFGMG